MISGDHLAVLAASGITPEHAKARGYETVHPCTAEQLAYAGRAFDQRTKDRSMLVGEGFTERMCDRAVVSPGLLVPLLDKRGDRWGWQLRNFTTDNGLDSQWAKYHSPLGQTNHIDVPPGVGLMLDDPDESLWITEGSKKADCAFLHGLCCIALLGVYGWRGDNGWDAVSTLPDWEEIPFRHRRTRKPRKVIVAFDGDIMRKDGVRQATFRFCQWLTYRGAEPHICWLPDGKEKVGIDDYLVGKG